MSSIQPAEVEKFSALADQWWDEGGKFRPLHQLNPVRIRYIRDQATAHFAGFNDLTILDIGCGGGLLCEPLARLGAQVTGLDASEKNIRTAKLHADQQGLPIQYIAGAAETLAEAGRRFDLVLAMEVIEHVADVDIFLNAAAKLVRPGGLLLFSTLNRTAKSFALAIVGAEYVLRWLPRGTHDWRKFLKPSEIMRPLEKAGMELKNLTGVSYDLLSRQWQCSRDVSVNYMLLARKRAN